jgi:hypothetical protein
MSNGTKAIMANITGGKIMKVRWNACYAASNILRKEEEEGQWRTDLINCLLDMVINFHNFKVISAQCERAIHEGFIVTTGVTVIKVEIFQEIEVPYPMTGSPNI